MARLTPGTQGGLMSHSSLHDTAPTSFIGTPGIRFAYRRFGREGGAAPVLFLQHFFGTMDTWDPLLTDRIAADRPVILFDNAGIGRTTGTTPTRITDMARHALSFVRALGIEKLDLFGFGLGGFIAQQILIFDPRLVRRAVLAGTGPRGGEGMSHYSPEVHSILSHVGPHATQRQLELFFAPTPTSQAAGKAWLQRIGRRRDLEPHASPAVGLAQLQAIQEWGRIDGERYAYLKAIHQPILVINGHNDIMVPTVNSFILQQQLPNARLLLYPDSGHAAHFQYASEVGPEVARFLD